MQICHEQDCMNDELFFDLEKQKGSFPQLRPFTTCIELAAFF
jgi:hypothetical protein